MKINNSASELKAILGMKAFRTTDKTTTSKMAENSPTTLNFVNELRPLVIYLVEN